LPDVPTFKEQGFPDVTLETEHFLLAPVGTPPQLLERFITKACTCACGNAVNNNVGSCRLLLQRLSQFIKQPRILDGDDSLGGKVLH
jgi:hypothetical protein